MHTFVLQFLGRKNNRASTSTAIYIQQHQAALLFIVRWTTEIEIYIHFTRIQLHDESPNESGDFGSFFSVGISLTDKTRLEIQ